MSALPAIAVVNAGSSSLKFSLFALEAGPGRAALAADGPARSSLRLLQRSQVEGLGTAPRFVAKDSAGRVSAQHAWGVGEALSHDGALDHVLSCLQHEFAHMALVGVGHRVVHGGMQFSAPTRLSAPVLRALEGFIPLAPLHQPHNLAPIRRLLHSHPALPQVACFDTAFHRSNPEIAQMFALPHALHEAGVRRYGFHGLSYEYIASVLPRVAPSAAAGRTLVLHLGNGASICALKAGRSIASSMGFTALDGLPMGTRCGTIDPGVLLYLMDQRGLDARALEKLLYSESGLLGVSGVSSDMRALEASAEPGALLARQLFAYGIAREIGSLAAALGGLDAIVFCAGIGENSADVRAAVCRACAWLGVELDAAANAAAATCISVPGSRCSAWIVPTDEEWMIAQHTARVLGLAGGASNAIIPCFNHGTPMTHPLYVHSVPVFKQMLTALQTVLAQAAEHVAAKSIEPDALLQARLYPDMFALLKQVQIAADFARGISARLAGVEVPTYDGKEKSFADLDALLVRTLAFLESLNASQFEGKESADIVLRPGTPKEKKLSGQNYLANYGAPQFFFHVTTAYAILRHNGMAIGKRDYMGAY